MAYHLEQDRLEEAERYRDRAKYEALLLNLALWNGTALQSHLSGEDHREDLPDEDLVFKHEMKLSDAAERALGVGKYAQGYEEVPAISPNVIKRAERYSEHGW